MSDEQTSHNVSRESFLQRILAAASGFEDTRVFCLMGPNGSGKTRFLKYAHRQLADKGIKCFTLPALRDIHRLYENDNSLPFHEPKNPVSGAFSSISEYQTPEPQSSSLHFQAFLNRTASLLVSSIMRDQHRLDATYNSALLRWAKSDDYLSMERPKPPNKMDAALSALLSKIIRREVIIQETKPGSIITSEMGVTIDGKFFNINLLSDGEKQLFLLSFFMLSREQKKFVCIVDEPELHLNEARAIEVWQEIENSLPNVTFVYATHSAAFATRENVGACATISRHGIIQEVDAGKLPPSAALTELVGARVQILRSDEPPVFCEDLLSKVFLESLLQGSGAQVVQLPGSHEVKMAATSREGWQDLVTTEMSFCGLIDRDARSDEECTACETEHLVVLPFFEAESVLIHPNIIKTLIRSTYDEREKDIDKEYRDILISCAKSKLGDTLKEHKGQVCFRHSEDFEFSHDLTRITSCKNVKGQSLRLKLFKRARIIFDALHREDEIDILKLFQGKEMYGKFRERLQRNLEISIHSEPHRTMRLIQNNEKLRSAMMIIPEIAELRVKLLRRLNLNE